MYEHKTTYLMIIPRIPVLNAKYIHRLYYI